MRSNRPSLTRPHFGIDGRDAGLQRGAVVSERGNVLDHLVGWIGERYRSSNVDALQRHARVADKHQPFVLEDSSDMIPSGNLAQHPKFASIDHGPRLRADPVFRADSL